MMASGFATLDRLSLEVLMREPWDDQAFFECIKNFLANPPARGEVQRLGRERETFAPL